MRGFRQISMAIWLAMALLMAGCGDDGETDTADPEPEAEEEAPADEGEGEGEPEEEAPAEEPAEETSTGGGAGGGTLTIGDETITLVSSRCFLEEQDAAAGGGKILFVGQGTGTNAAGDDVLLDVSRYNEDSQFAGDDVLVDIGDFETGYSLSSTSDIGTVQLDGRTLSADGLSFTNFDDFSEVPGSFVLNC